MTWQCKKTVSDKKWGKTVANKLNIVGIDKTDLDLVEWVKE